MTVPGAGRGALPLPPPAYAQAYMNQFVRQLETIFNQLKNPGPLICSSDGSTDSRAKSGLQIIGAPIDTYGLKSGDVWADISGTSSFIGTGSISADTLTITAVTSGTLAVGNGVTYQTAGVYRPMGITVSAILTGSGGIGTYKINQSLTASSTTITGFTSPTLRIIP